MLDNTAYVSITNDSEYCVVIYNRMMQFYGEELLITKYERDVHKFCGEDNSVSSFVIEINSRTDPEDFGEDLGGNVLDMGLSWQDVKYVDADEISFTKQWDSLDEFMEPDSPHSHKVAVAKCLHMIATDHD